MGEYVVWCGVVWCGVVCGVVWCGVVWCGVVWCGVCIIYQYSHYIKRRITRFNKIAT